MSAHVKKEHTETETRLETERESKKSKQESVSTVWSWKNTERDLLGLMLAEEASGL